MITFIKNQKNDHLLNLIFFIIFICVNNQVRSQYKINNIDKNGIKQGLWIERENGITKKVMFFVNDSLDGFSFDFNDSGEITTHTYYQKGMLTYYHDSLYPSNKQAIFYTPENFSGRLRLDTTNDEKPDVWVLKNGCLHGIHQLNTGHKHRRKARYREYISFNGWAIYLVFFDKKHRPVSYYDLSKLPTDFIIENWNIKKDNLSITYYNPLNKRINVPNLTYRSLSYKKKHINKRYYNIFSDTLVLTIEKKPTVDALISDGFYDGKFCRAIMEQHIVYGLFVDDFLFPFERKTVSVKIVGLHKQKINTILYYYNGKLY
ncbi:MAG TPA: hypothetical protein VEC12_10800 [Bacteroidia bacterium]|nr:hypothetical protein [Bacteroidia bacterium]